MRVLRLIADLAPLRGGPPVSAANSAIAMARRGVETHVACISAGNVETSELEAERRLRAEGIGVTRLPRPALLAEQAHSVGYSPQLAGYLEGNLDRFDLVHVHGAWTYSSVTAVRIARRRRIPVVMTPHEGLTAFDLGHARLPGLRSMKSTIKRYYRDAVDSFVFSSPLEARDSVQGLPAERCHVVWHPVADERSAEAALAPPLGDRGGLRIGMLGRFHSKKNIENVVAAVAGLPSSVMLCLAGAGGCDVTEALRRCVSAFGMTERTSWAGFVQGADKQAFLCDIDILAMPSDYECFGMAAVEAMIAGRPVLVAPQVGVADVIRNYRAGYVAGPGVEALRSVFERLQAADRCELRDAGARAAAAAHDCFSFEAHGAALEAVYRDCIATRQNTGVGTCPQTQRVD